MKIDLNTVDDGLAKVEGVFCGIPAVLITPPHIGFKFNQKTKIFRSSIWDMNGNLLSASFPKFVNFLENPDNFPVPTSLNGCNIVTKMDGSTLICDWVNNQFSMRTRGTMTYLSQKNAADFEYVAKKYPLVEIFLKNCPTISLIFEIVTPNQRVVIDYGNTPDIFLIGAIHKDTYYMAPQKALDGIAGEIGVKRPEYFTVDTLENLMQFIKDHKTIEGCCIYSKNDQEIHKVKSDLYLKLHALKSDLSLESVIDMFLEYDKPNHQDFMARILKEFNLETVDWELIQSLQSYVSKVCDGWKEVVKIEQGMDEFIKKNLINNPFCSSRKAQAQKVFESYGKESNRSSFVFKLMDGKKIDKEGYKKLLFQVVN